MRTQIGFLDVSAFAVAETCEGDTIAFFSEDGRYGLRLWKEAEWLVNPLREILRNEVKSFEMLLEELHDALDSSVTSELVAAALMTHPDQLIQKEVFCWTSAKMGVTTDIASLTFDDLIPD